MKNYLLKFDQKLLQVIRAIGKEADRKQMTAYVIGGVVRDIILKKKNYDLDISVEGDAIILAKAILRKTKARLVVHTQFKTASLQWPGGIRVDLATVRKERYPHSGALPVVQVGTLREDLYRRDFTINAMAIVINSSNFGQLIDEFGGIKDIASKKIRILHIKSFIDDPTRILRAIRFEQRLGFKIERQTFSQLKSALKKNTEKKVKPPRYFAEFKNMLTEDDPIKPLKRLHGLKGFRFLSAKFNIRFHQLKSIHSRIGTLKKKRIYTHYDFWWLIYFISLIAKSDHRVVQSILKKYPFTKVERKSILQCRKVEDTIAQLSARQLTSSQIYQILKPFTKESIVFLRVQPLNTLVSRRIDRYLANDIHVKLQINGEDLKKLGVLSGVKIGRILESVLYSKIDRQVRTKQDELNQALQASWKF